MPTQDAHVAADANIKEEKQNVFKTIQGSDEALGKVWCEIKSRSF